MRPNEDNTPEAVTDAPTKPERAVSMLELVYGGMRVAAALAEPRTIDVHYSELDRATARAEAAGRSAQDGVLDVLASEGGRPGVDVLRACALADGRLTPCFWEPR